MKSKKITFLAAIVILFSATACKEKPQTTEEQEKIDIVKDTGPQKMQEYDLSDTLTVNNTKYEFSIKRTPNDSLQKVEVESKKIFYDNNITLTIKRRDDKSVFFQKTFTKNSFKEYIPASFLNKSVLLGIVFNYDMQQEHGKFCFAASVGDPEDDELLFPLKLTIMPSKEIKIEKDDLLDTYSQSTENMNIDPQDEEGI